MAAKRKKKKKIVWCVMTGKKKLRKVSCHRLKRDAKKKALALRAKRGTGVRVVRRRAA